jgi:hypothetical protein
MKTRPDALGTVKNKYGRAKNENASQRLGIAENNSESAKYENGTRLPRYRQKRVRERKT